MVNRKKAALSLALMAAVALTGSLSVYASEANAQGNPPVVTAVAQIPEASSSLHVDNTKWNYDETNDIYYQIGLVYCAKPQATEYESLAVYVPGAYMPSLHVDNTKWNYDETNDIYYQIGLVYCAKPQATEYESLAVYVPGAYMQGVKNPDGTYTCQINPKAKVGNYTTVTAPVVMPVNTGGYAAQKAPSSYDGTGLSTYLSQGFVYVYAGCRGRNNGTNPDGTAYDSGAPWGVTDLKAAVRYLRCNDSLIPGNKNRIFTFGHSGGGAQSALMGATGDSEMYMPYLSSIGALMKDSQGKPLSDAIDGAMCWCPITNLTQADLSYEWMMGQFSSEGTRAYGTWTRSLSRDMARAYADSLNRMGLRDEQGNVLTLTQSESGIYMAGPYGTWTRSLSRDMARAYADSLNRMGLRDEQGNVLTLTQSESGIYMAGPYYDYLKTTIETSLNNFLKDNQFPLTTGQSDFQVDGAFPGQGAQESMGGWTPPKGAPVMPMAQEEPHTYNSAKEYIDALNGDNPWITYDEKTNTATISSVEAFVEHMKQATKSVGAFDDKEYIDALNGDNPWITYDEKTNTATISSVEAFVEHMKQATKSVGAFDDLQKAQAENLLFGNGQNDALHFDGNMTYFMEKRQNTYKNYRNGQNDALHFDGNMTYFMEKRQNTYKNYSDYDDSIRQAYEGDMNNVDALHVDTLTRQLMYDPMTFILVPAGEKKPSTLAKHWRIHTGISQGDTALTTEVNLALALKQRKDVEDVDFATVWEKKHTMAERTGSSTENFIQWVKDSVASEK